MIISNGYIQPKHKAVTTQAVIDPATGHPRKGAVEASWGERIECQYSANRYNALGRVLGEPHTERSYEILIEAQPFAAEQVRLLNLAGGTVGEFSIISATPLDAVGQIKLLV